VGLWDQIRATLSAVWADIQSPRVDEHTQLVTWLTQSGGGEHDLALQIRQLIPAIPYAQFRQRLEAMARDDEQHAALLQRYLGILSGTAWELQGASDGSANSLPTSPWRRVLRVLLEKRELYERYRQAASVVDDPSLRTILQQLRDDEERHQEELIEMLTQLDAHIHETID
jgi:rubrerythrin